MPFPELITHDKLTSDNSLADCAQWRSPIHIIDIILPDRPKADGGGRGDG